MRTQTQDAEFPLDVQAIVQKKYTWNVKLTNKRFFNRSKCFQVESIDVSLGRQPMIHAVAPVLALASAPLRFLNMSSQVADSSATTRDDAEVRYPPIYTMYL